MFARVLTLQAMKQFNSSQQCVINRTVDAACRMFAHPRICLIQGPPGTGKTHTISGIVSTVLKVKLRSVFVHDLSR